MVLSIFFEREDRRWRWYLSADGADTMALELLARQCGLARLVNARQFVTGIVSSKAELGELAAMIESLGGKVADIDREIERGRRCS